MTKLVSTLSLGLLVALGGCSLYFGESEDGRGGDSRPPGLSCESNADCAAGCFCEDGTCEEAGFCTTSEDCPDGFHCDDRSSCVPDTCDADNACPTGQVCDNGQCTSTCECSSDAEAQAGGYGYCDEATSTCYPGTDPAGSCGGAVTCATDAPNCAVGEVPLIVDGCYTGACKAIAQCDVTPACDALDNTTDCTARASDCAIVSTGHNCTKADGSACVPGDVGCTCESFTFAACETRTQAKPASSHWVRSTNGGYVDFASMFH
ncbi:MAG: hypothetical protein ABI867_12725 [Kofleriaceae bacterium]